MMEVPEGSLRSLRVPKLSLLIVPDSCLKAISSLQGKEGNSKHSLEDSLSWRDELEIGNPKVAVAPQLE